MRTRARHPAAARAGKAAALAGLALLALAPAPGDAAAAAAEPAVAAPLAIVGVRVTPAAPGAATLCQLHVTLRNGGDRQASELGFAVRVGGVELPAYRNRLFMARLAPGETREVRLYNFWTTETGRPAPADGRYRVEVELRQARWYEVTAAGEAETWVPIGPVAGLPVRAAIVTGG